MIAPEKSKVLADSSAPVVTRFLRPARAAQYMGISRAGFYNLLNEGGLKSHRVGGARLIDREELDRFVLAHSAD